MPTQTELIEKARQELRGAGVFEPSFFGETPAKLFATDSQGKVVYREGGVVSEPSQKTSEIGFMSTDKASEYVKKGNETLDRISGADTTYYKKPEETIDQYNERIAKFREGQ